MNVFTCVGPSWFSGIAIMLELIFAIVTSLIAYFSYNAYKLLKKREILLFGISFFSIALGYLIEVIFNFSQIYKITRAVLEPVIGSVAHQLNLGFFVSLVHIILFVLGLTLLVYLTVPKRSKKLYCIISGLALIALFTSANIVLTFFLISSLMLFGLTLYYYQMHCKKRSISTLYNFVGFGAIFLGHLQLAVTSGFSMLYIASHITTFFGFILLMMNLYRAIK